MGRGNGGTRATRGGVTQPAPGTQEAPKKATYEPPTAGEYIRVTDRGMTPAQREKILPFENRRSNNKIEYAMVVDKDGNVLFEKKGGSRSVSVPITSRAIDGVLTHNHPMTESVASGSRFYAAIGSPFSRQDVEGAIYQNLAEVRARTPNYVFSMRRRGNSWGISRQAFSSEYQRLYRDRLTAAREYYRAQDLTPKEKAERLGRVNVNLYHTMMKELAKKYGFIYTRTKVK